MAKKDKDKDKVAINASFDFFKTVKTGDKFTDAGKKREINTWIDTGSYTLNALIEILQNKKTELDNLGAVGENITIYRDYCDDQYIDISYVRLETDEEFHKRLETTRKREETKRKRRETMARNKEAKEREEYERLKRKFES